MSFKWQFNTMRPSDKAREPIASEYFATDAIDNPGEALVREGIQNSLDARRNGEKVMVRIRVSGVDSAVSRDVVAPFLNGLDEHLRAPGNGLREIPGDQENCPFIVFEDFGTTGLTGDPAEWKPQSGSKNHFYHFFRAEGRSDKGEKNIGRWGLGKQVFLRASRINTLFGLTVRSDDSKKLLMGMAVLKSHDLKGTRYAPDGWLGRPAENGDEGLILPIDDNSFIDQFIRVFDIQRGDQEPGLTIVVPWCDLDLTDENLVRAVLRGYFWPILRGQLEVNIKARNIQTLLDANSLESEIKKIGNDLEHEMSPLVELAKWAGAQNENDFIRLACADPSRAWQWSKELLPIDSLDELRQRYERGDKIALRVPVTVREKNKEPRETYFDVFIYRDGSEQGGYPVFIREAIIIPDVRAPRTRGVRAIVNAEDAAIAAFLGDSENPAHTQWQHDGANFRGKYASGKSDLEFVKRAVYEIVNILCDEEETKKHSIWVNLFSIPAVTEESKAKAKEHKIRKEKGKEPDVPTPPEPRPRPIIIDRIEGGFVVRNGDMKGAPPPRMLLIRAAYHVRRRNPFKKYHPADFDFSQRMKTKVENATVREKKENRLRVKINAENFRIEVTGFDPKRDVHVKVRQQEDDNAGSYN